MQEEWRPVVGYGGLYSISNLGGVRAEEIERPSKWGTMMKVPERIMAAPELIEQGVPRYKIVKELKICPNTLRRIFGGVPCKSK